MSDYPSMSHVQHITFEGNDCVVMSPEEYGAALADLEAKDYELSALRAELTEARRQLKEASEQEPVGWRPNTANTTANYSCGLPRMTDILYWRDIGVELELVYAAPVPQPAVPEAVAKDAVLRAMKILDAAREIQWGSGNQPYSMIAEAQVIIENAILSATDSEVKK